MTTFYPQGTGDEVWKPFSTDGRLPNLISGRSQQRRTDRRGDCCALHARPRREEDSADGVVLGSPADSVWRRPQMGTALHEILRRGGHHAWKIASTALEHDENVEPAQIDAWQKPYIEDESKPLWFRGELFNEMYILADGGTVWAHELDGIGNPKHLSAKDADSFSYLECFDYPYYGTSDVRFYGSFPLIRFWPEIEKQEMREYADTIPEKQSAKLCVELEDRPRT